MTAEEEFVKAKVTPQEAYKLLCTKGRIVLVNLNDQSIGQKPVWFDEQRFAKGKSAIDNFFIG